MKLPVVAWEQSGLTDAGLKAAEAKLAPELEKLKAASGTLYDDDRASMNLPLDKHHLTLCKKLAKQHAKASLIVIVGIGGSNLGALAVANAVLGTHHNLEAKSGPQLLCADTVDPHQMARTVRIVDDHLKRNKHVVINAISKSGGTTETIANLEIFLDTLKRRKCDPRKHVVITSDEDSRLTALAKDQGFDTLPIPKKVGGRYSVLSPVGLFPLALAGIDIDDLMDGAAHMRARCLETAHGENPAAIRAALLALARADGRNIADHFAFASDLESIGKWYRQLMGESVGKEWDAAHQNRVWMGITPTVSIGSTDLHSMAQLYFGGPNDKVFTILTVKKWEEAISVPHIEEYDALVPHIQGKPLSTIMDAIVLGTQSVLANQKRPYCTIELPDLSATSIGALMQLHMMEMMMLAALLGVNPFDQPNVEAYKVETKAALAKR